jgi:hypothetical protein
MFPPHTVSPAVLAARLQTLIPEYLPGLDTGAFEPTDRRRCWNKTISKSLELVAREDLGLRGVVENSALTPQQEQLRLSWRRDGRTVFAMATAWGGRAEVQQGLDYLEELKSPDKLLVYSCTKWQDAVIDQIEGSLLEYPYHLKGERYLFFNLLGMQNRFELMTCEVDHDGLPYNREDVRLHPVSGSPFAWSTGSRAL